MAKKPILREELERLLRQFDIAEMLLELAMIARSRVEALLKTPDVNSDLAGIRKDEVALRSCIGRLSGRPWQPKTP